MKKLFSLLIVFASLTTSAHGLIVEAGPYAQIMSGPNWAHARHGLKNKSLDADFKQGFMVGAAVGYRLKNGLRIEEEYSYHHNRVIVKNDVIRTRRPGRGHIRAHSQTSAVLVNFLWEVPFECVSITPYAGGGIGYGWTTYRAGNNKVRTSDHATYIAKNHHRRGNSYGFAWQGIVGLLYPVTCKTDIALEYRYFRAGKRLSNNICSVAAKYKF